MPTTSPILGIWGTDQLRTLQCRRREKGQYHAHRLEGYHIRRRAARLLHAALSDHCAHGQGRREPALREPWDRHSGKRRRQYPQQWWRPRDDAGIAHGALPASQLYSTTDPHLAVGQWQGVQQSFCPWAAVLETEPQRHSFNPDDDIDDVAGGAWNDATVTYADDFITTASLVAFAVHISQGLSSLSAVFKGDDGQANHSH